MYWSQGAVNPRDMAMAPGGPGGAPAKGGAVGAGRGVPPHGKPQGGARGGPLGRPSMPGGGPGKQAPDKPAASAACSVQVKARQPAVPRLPHLPNHHVQGRQAVPAAAAGVGRGAQQQGAAMGSSITQLGRKRSLNGKDEAASHAAKQPDMPPAANGKRRTELSASQQKAWLDFAKPSSGTAAAPNSAGVGVAGSDNGGNAAQGSSAAADDGTMPEARSPSGGSQEQSSPGGSKLGLGGSFLPVRSPRTTRGNALWAPFAVPSVSSPPKKRAKTAEDDAIQPDKHASAQAQSPKGNFLLDSFGSMLLI